MELNPEQYFEIQTAAKAFMLDGNHPERYDIIGGRENRSAKLVTTKLFESVRVFLEEYGWGEKMWGNDAPPLEDLTPRTLRWPESKTA